jgi:hypothetical protein
MMPFHGAIKGNLEKLKNYDLKLIAPSHGPLYPRPAFIMEAYWDWVAADPQNIVVLPYASMHGSTEKMVERLISALVEKGITVEPFNLAVTDIGKLAMGRGNPYRYASQSQGGNFKPGYLQGLSPGERFCRPGRTGSDHRRQAPGKQFHLKSNRGIYFDQTKIFKGSGLWHASAAIQPAPVLL